MRGPKHPFLIYERLLHSTDDKLAGEIIAKCRALAEKKGLKGIIAGHCEIADRALQGDISRDILVFMNDTGIKDAYRGFWLLSQRLAAIEPSCQSKRRIVFLETNSLDPEYNALLAEALPAQKNTCIQGFSYRPLQPRIPVTPEELYAYLKPDF